MQHFLEQIHEFNPVENQSLSKFTTWRIGGLAEILVEINNSDDLEKLLLMAIKNQIPYTILGNGSNILISDNGIKGLVIINKSKNIEFTDIIIPSEQQNPYIEHRHLESGDTNFYSFSDLDYTESADGKLVIFDSGVMLPYAINKTLLQGLTGLQWFAGIPGTMGGSLYNNIHGGTKHFSENFISARIIDADGIVKDVDYDFFNFGYDQSILRINPKIVILKLTLNLIQGNLEKANFVAKEWLKRKAIQPKNSCGSVFQAIPTDKANELDYPTNSAGYIVDKILNLKGHSIGNIQISQIHSNFMVNNGGASAIDTLNLIKLVQHKTKEKIGIDLKPEINFLGFSNEELTNVR